MPPKNQTHRIDDLLGSVTEELLLGSPQQFEDNSIRVERLLLEMVRPDPVQPRRVLPEQLHFAFHSNRLGSWVKRVKGNQLSNESGRDTFDIASEFTQGNVASQVLLMNPFERTNEVAHIGPQPFGGVAVDFTEAVPIVIARPFMLTMTDAVALTSDAVVALVFIGVDNRLAQGKAVRMGTQGGTL